MTFDEFYAKKLSRGEAVEAHCNYLEKRQRALKGTSVEVSDIAMSLYFTSSLGDEWKAFVSVLRASFKEGTGEHAPTYVNYKRRIVDEDSLNNKKKTITTTHEGNRNRGAMRADQDTNKCTNCGRPGHNESTCWSEGGGAVDEAPWNKGYKPKFQKRRMVYTI
jgi:hypothetical protein